MKYFWGNQNQKVQSKSSKPSFKEKYNLQQRIKNRQKLQVKYPKGFFVYAVLSGLSELTQRDKNFMLVGVQKKLTVLYLIQYLRKSLLIDENKAIFISVRDKINNMTQTVGQLYDRFAQQDGFIYIDIKPERSFGENSL